MMPIKRRHLLTAAPLLPLVAIAQPAAAQTTDLVLNCDTALGPVMTTAASRFFQRTSVRVRVFPTPPGLVFPQLARQIQNDLICTQKGIGEAAIQADLVDPAALRGAWRNKFVLAARQGASPDALKGRIAVSDPTPASDIDGPAVIHSLQLGQSAILGVIDTDEVVYLLQHQEADAGLLHMTDVQTNPGLQVLRVLPDDTAPPVTYAVAVTKLATRPNPQAFVDFLLTPEGTAVLKSQGLETAA